MSLVVPVSRANGEPAVAQGQLPRGGERARGRSPLRVWDGRGAARLLDSRSRASSAAHRALRPGRAALGRSPTTRRRRELRPASARGSGGPCLPTRSSAPLAGEANALDRRAAARWRGVSVEPFERAILDEAVSACLELGPDQRSSGRCSIRTSTEATCFAAERETWLAIDPKPLVGEREFDAASLLRDRRWLLGGRNEGADEAPSRPPRGRARARPRADAQMGDRATPSPGASVGSRIEATWSSALDSCEVRTLGSAPWTPRFLERALELAERGRGTTHPNPIVGRRGRLRRRGRRRGLARAQGRPARRGRRARGGRQRTHGARRST